MTQETVAEIMSRKLVSVKWNEPLQDAEVKMAKLHVRHLPVVDGTGAVVGILSDRDLKRAEIPLTDRQKRPENVPPLYHPGQNVGDYMSWPVKMVSDETPLLDVVQLVLEHKISALLITSGQSKVVHGIVTTDDLLRVLAEVLGREPSAKLLRLEQFSKYIPLYSA